MENDKKQKLVRKKKTMDGNQAAAHVSYAYSEVAAIYPITPSSTMAELAGEWSTENKINIFGETVSVTEMQSEAGAAGAVHGALTAGALTTTFTASQGLLLMLPNIYKIAGELLPGVFQVAARTIATHALSIFGDHSDVYACRQTGAAMLAEASVQEVMDLSVVAHLSAIRGHVPFINFFDGFRTSHEMQKIEVWDYDTLRELADQNEIDAFRQSALNPNHARLMGSAQNPDVFFQAREAANPYYEALPGIVEGYMEQINALLGTKYRLFQYYGATNAKHVMVAMGSVCETIEETVDYLNEQGNSVGLLKVHLYRPFSTGHFLSALPDTVEKLTVLDRTKEPGGVGEPLYLDVVAALKTSGYEQIKVFAGRYGLASKDTTPSQIYAAFMNMDKQKFTIGIEDDVTHLSLGIDQRITTCPEDAVGCRFWGLGADGTVGACKNTVKIIGDNTDLYVQAYFEYDSKKSGGVTISNLRFGRSPIRSAYLVSQADFVACHNQTYIQKYNMVQELKDGGIFLLNCGWDRDDLEKELPGQVKAYIAKHHISFYTIDGIAIGKEIGLNSKINTILQAAFFQLSGILPQEEVQGYMKHAAEVTYRSKGDRVVEMNYQAIEKGASLVQRVSVPEHWKDAAPQSLLRELTSDRPEVLDFVHRIQDAVNMQEGNSLPVSAFTDYVNGSTPSGTSAHERRNVAVDIPVWLNENCIQCNRCSMVCPHVVIRPAILTQEEYAKAPEAMKTVPMQGFPQYQYGIVISQVDCTGCGSCAAVCPGKKGEKALVMVPVQDHEEHQEFFDYAKTLSEKEEVFERFPAGTTKGCQFLRPLLEFSGACAGCGETPYAKLATQLFGKRMYIANATGCTSIWGNSSPSTPYTVNALGQGPAWSNSLFEDAAEFGLGMKLGEGAVRDRLRGMVVQLLDISNKMQEQGGKFETEVSNIELLSTEADKGCRNDNDEGYKTGRLIQTAKVWLETYENGNENWDAANQLIMAIEEIIDDKTESENQEGADEKIKLIARGLYKEKDFLSKKSKWIYGGDGWAYDIGFGGLDHVLASGQDINILVMDTEVYSNTGGQASKATPLGSVAKFATDGKEIRKKDLAGMAMTYGYVYVAQIAMGADYNQTVKAFIEAEQYPGPSLIIAYSPCISHGIRAGMGSSQSEEAKAVEAGYWHLFRFHPGCKEKGENPFILDSRKPVLRYEDFLTGEIRYDSLKRSNPERAELLFERAEKAAQERYLYLKSLVELYGNMIEKDNRS